MPVRRFSRITQGILYFVRVFSLILLVIVSLAIWVFIRENIFVIIEIYNGFAFRYGFFSLSLK